MENSQTPVRFEPYIPKDLAVGAIRAIRVMDDNIERISDLVQCDLALGIVDGEEQWGIWLPASQRSAWCGDYIIEGDPPQAMDCWSFESAYTKFKA